MTLPKWYSSIMFNFFNYLRMKNYLKYTLQNLKSQITIIAMIMFCLSCHETMITKDFTSDLDLISAIKNAKNKVTISKNSLPEETKISISFNYYGNYISKSELAPELGYQVDLRKHKGMQVANKTVTYFDIDGRMLLADEDFKAKRAVKGKKKGNRKNKDLEDCFDFVYPFTLVMPDVSEIEISDTEGWDFVKAWYEANPEEQERPTFVFPLNILVENSEMEINNENEFKVVAEGCKNGKGHSQGKEDCFEVVYPFTLKMPDSTLITLESNDGKAAVKAWHEAHPDVRGKGVFVFPINIIFEGNEMKINGQDELKAIAEQCKNGKSDGRKKEDCFEIVYPFTLSMPDGTLITLESDDDREAVKAWHNAHPEVKDKGVFVFPINILVEGNKMKIHDQSEFKAIAEQCKNGKSDDRKKEDCFEIVYPFTLLMPDGTLITLESDDDRETVKAWHEAHPEVREKGVFVFPISLEYPQGDIVEIDSKEDFEEIKKDCYGDDSDG